MPMSLSDAKQIIIDQQHFEREARMRRDSCIGMFILLLLLAAIPACFVYIASVMVGALSEFAGRYG